MPDVRLKTRIQNKYKTLDEWNSLSKGEFIPLKGEICYATVNNDTVYQKIGDGITDFTELEWLNTVGVDVVNTFNDLSKNAKKDDIAFVEEPAIVEKVENEPTIMALDFVHPNVAEPIVLNTNNQTRMLSELDWGENYPYLAGEDKSYYIEIGLQGDDGDAYDLEAMSQSAEMAKDEYGLSHPVELYELHTNKNFELIKLKGMTIKKYIYNRFDKGLTEEQMEIFLGEHYDDVLSPNVSYNWIKLSTTSEPLNETSVLKGQEYCTLEYDVDVNLSTKAYIVGVGYAVIEGTSENYLLNNFYEDFSTLSSNELIEACNYINFFLSGIFNRGIKEISYDKYGNIGFQYFKDNKWDSLESKMNLTKVVKQYKDLPKTFITNGIAAVSQYSKVATRPFTTIGLETYFNLYLDINVSQEDMIQSTYKLLGLSQDTSHDFSLGVEWTDIDDNHWGGFYAHKRNDQFMIRFTEPGNPFRKYDDNNYYSTWDEYKEYIYISQDNTYLDIGSAYDKNDGNDYSNYYFETAGWYSCLIWDDGKTPYIKEAPVKVENSEYLFDGKAIRITSIEEFTLAPEGEESLELSNFEFAAFKFKIPNSYQEYPQGFYKFNGKEWNYAPTINGPKFTNKQLLDQITEEDIGNIVLNTEARHTHDNKSILDSITEENLFSNQIAQAISDEILKCQEDIEQLQNELIGINSLTDEILETIGGES